jgi:hypothetical protein
MKKLLLGLTIMGSLSGMAYGMETSDTNDGHDNGWITVGGRRVNFLTLQNLPEGKSGLALAIAATEEKKERLQQRDEQLAHYLQEEDYQVPQSHFSLRNFFWNYKKTIASCFTLGVFGYVIGYLFSKYKNNKA